MVLKINGYTQDVKGIENLAELIYNRQLTPEHIVVEYNQHIVARPQWEHTALSENDVIEIVSFVGGG